jgi:hypothetical protein
MRKLVVTVLILLTLVSYRANAQTKGETISWILEKIGNYSAFSVDQKGSIITLTAGSDGMHVSQKYIFDINDIESYNVDGFSNPPFTGSIYFITNGYKIKYHQVIESVTNDGTTYSSDDMVNVCAIQIKFNAEFNLQDRLTTALANLVLFNQKTSTEPY